MKKIYALVFLVFCSNVFAASFPSYYCPTTYKTIRTGDTLDSVQANCGAPTSTTTRQVQITTPVNTTQWIYSLGGVSIKGAAFFLPSMIITFDANKTVTEIRSGGTQVIMGGSCSSTGMVKIGDPMNTVLAVCGTPNYVNNNQTAATSTKDILEWTYSFGPYQPRIILDFENSVLTQISSGQLGG